MMAAIASRDIGMGPISHADVQQDTDEWMRALEEDSDEPDLEDSQVLRNSIVIYGGALFVIVFLFSFLRPRFPRVYNVRGSKDAPEELKTHLADDDRYHFFNWMWKVVTTVTDDELMEECGLDAACFTRILSMGYRLKDSSATLSVTDSIEKTTIAHVPAGSPRLYATVFAAYVMFGSTMYLILQEFEWYIEMRHKFLRKDAPRNFSVFVRNIPSDFQSNPSLETFFKDCFTEESVLEARVPLKIPALAKAVGQRESNMANLEHALAQYEQTGSRPKHHPIDLTGGLKSVTSEVDSIDTYTKLLEEQNDDVSGRIAALEKITDGHRSETNDQTIPDKSAGREDEIVLGGALSDDDQKSTQSYYSSIVSVVSLFRGTSSTDGAPSVTTEQHENAFAESETEPQSSTSDERKVESIEEDVSEESSTKPLVRKSRIGKSINKATHTASHVASRATHAAGNVANKATNAASAVASRAASLIKSSEDGSPHSSGFVVFKKLSTANAALQMIHHESPFSMEISEAPDPREIFWFNIGREHKDLQIGRLISVALTAGLCFLWTIPMSFFASLSNAEAVRKDVDFLDDLFNDYPGLIPVLEQLAPFLVVVFNALLPMILESISMFEGPFSTGAVEASLFVKLAAFMIIQTFFVSAISGSVIQAISAILDDWTEIIDLLANSLPSQGTYFMQILLVSTATTAGMELLRVVAIVMASLRSFIGPRLTEKERNKAYMGLRPLSDPKPFEHADFTSQLVLYFMVLFVYCTISPMTPFITGFCFLLMGSMFRYQFVFIYAKHPDSGGKLWSNFIQILLTCMLIAEITIFGLLGLKKAVKQLPLYIPLLCVTILFNIYIRAAHFRVASYLPTRECLKADLDRDPDFDFSFLVGAYTQPPLKAEKKLKPEGALAVSEQQDDVSELHSTSVTAPNYHSITPSRVESV